MDVLKISVNAIGGEDRRRQQYEYL